jgi:SAM-dependent methyltransferase
MAQFPDSEAEGRYTNGQYLACTGGTWHSEDAEFKCRMILHMLQRHPTLALNRIYDVGCGAGCVLARLQKALPPSVRLQGWDISPQAISLAMPLANERLLFTLGDSWGEAPVSDLLLCMDVVEHVDDPIGFLRALAKQGKHKILHIPLDIHVSAVLRGSSFIRIWDGLGHIHSFTLETALKTVEHSGMAVRDWFFTDGALRSGSRRGVRTRIGNLGRLVIGTLSKKWASRLLGGYSVLILAE